MLTRIIIAVCLAVALAGTGYGLWQGEKADRRAAEVAELSKVVREQKAALAGAEARSRALSVRLKTAEARKKEEKENAQADQWVLEQHPEWASQPIPPAVLERLQHD